MDLTTGVPNTRTPRSFDGMSGSPRHTVTGGFAALPAAMMCSHPIGKTPAWFWVFPWLILMRAWVHNSVSMWLCNVACALVVRPRRGHHGKQGASHLASNSSEWHPKPLYCSSANKAGINGSPCSPPSPCKISWTSPRSSATIKLQDKRESRIATRCVTQCRHHRGPGDQIKRSNSVH